MKRVLYIFMVFIGLVGLISLLGLDIRTSNLLYSGKWIYQKFFLWDTLYNYGNIFPNILGITSIILFIASLFFKGLSPIKNKILFSALVFVIGPGLIVQTLKVTWGRPRPAEITNYGGNLEFRTPFEPNIKLAGNKTEGNSFPSGHAANGFYTMVIYFIFRKKWILSLTFSYGILMGIARIVQGGHFLSDIVSSFFIVYIGMELFKFLITKKTKIRSLA